MDEKMRTMSFRLPEDMYTRLIREAANADRTATSMLHIMIKFWFANNKRSAAKEPGND